MNKEIEKKSEELVEKISKLNEEERIETLNEIRRMLSSLNPIQDHPVDLVRWVRAEKVVANDYNPNSVAPPEMKLLKLSIERDGYTQPIVAFYDKKQDKYIVVDGFHRNRVGKEYQDIKKSVKGYLPIVVIDKDIKDRMASTVRHNRARGVHGVKPMSELVAELYFKGWSDKRIALELGMDKEEVLRMKQFTGIGSLFQSRKFSRAWIIKE